ncbi:MAG: gamma-glutamyl phosphate reductase [Rhodospirillales bacterium]|nr:gamma-glutamyl phosphate reductase [Rhodospirillales bacterium]
MRVTELLPDAAERPVRDILNRLDAAPSLLPFAPDALHLLADLSRRILGAKDLARAPDAVALGYWLRPANLARLGERYPPLAHGGLRVPAGVAFQIPPSNVDMMFAYSWAAGLLAGNRQIVRLSRRRGELADRLLAVIGQALAGSVIAQGTAFIDYDRDDAITAAISARCDLRVIWGGDATVAAIRAIPLAPHAKETVFADRLSLSILSAAAVLDLDDKALADVAGRLFNDVLTFDQMACSSPRRLIWLGPADAADPAEMLLTAAMAAEIRRRDYRIATATALEKYAAACRAAIRGSVRAIERSRTDWVLVDLGDGPAVPPDDSHPGAGLLYRCRVDAVAEIAPMIDRSVQTLTHFGIDRATLEALARTLAGKGIDRMVPLGQALAFDLVWDGYDLIDEFTRRVAIG